MAFAHKRNSEVMGEVVRGRNMKPGARYIVDAYCGGSGVHVAANGRAAHGAAFYLQWRGTATRPRPRTVLSGMARQKLIGDAVKNRWQAPAP